MARGLRSALTFSIVSATATAAFSPSSSGGIGGRRGLHTSVPQPCRGRAALHGRRSREGAARRLAASSSSSGDFDATKGGVYDDAAPSSSRHGWTRRTARLAIPSLVGMIADPLLSLIDTMFVARLGSVPLAALGACTSVFHLAFNAFRATTASTAALVAASLVRAENDADADFPAGEGGGDYEDDEEDEAKVVARTSLRLAVASGTIVSILLLAFASPILRGMGIRGDDAALLPPALSYLRWRAVAAPAVLFLTASEGIFRGHADATTPLVISLVAAGINLVLDPLCMFCRPFRMGIKGAAVATAISQFCAAGLYWRWLVRRKMIPPSSGDKAKAKRGDISRRPKRPRTNGDGGIAATILRANAAMFAKQGSLLLGWAFATRRATRLGPASLAAHQVALSVWLVVALMMDGAGVAAQVLMSGEWERLRIAKGRRRSEAVSTEAEETAATPAAAAKDAVLSLSLYMTALSLLQGLAGSLALLGLGFWKPAALFTADPAVSSRVASLIPHLAANMVLVSATLVTESLAVGGGRFRWLAAGTAASSVWAVTKLNGAPDVVGIWSGGIVSLFAGRFLTAALAVLDMNGAFRWRKRVASAVRKRRDGFQVG